MANKLAHHVLLGRENKLNVDIICFDVCFYAHLILRVQRMRSPTLALEVGLSTTTVSSIWSVVDLFSICGDESVEGPCKKRQADNQAMVLSPQPFTAYLSQQ